MFEICALQVDKHNDYTLLQKFRFFDYIQKHLTQSQNVIIIMKTKIALFIGAHRHKVQT